MKNPTSGDPRRHAQISVQAAQSGHRFLYRGCDVTTSGNTARPLHPARRRGQVRHPASPNYHYEDLVRLFELYGKRDLHNPAAIVDCNHSNSNKKFREQIRIAGEVMHSRKYTPRPEKR